MVVSSLVVVIGVGAVWVVGQYEEDEYVEVSVC